MRAACGHKGATLQHPGWIENGVGWQPFQVKGPVEFPTTTHGKIGIMTLKNRTLSALAQRFSARGREAAGESQSKDGK